MEDERSSSSSAAGGGGGGGGGSSSNMNPTVALLRAAWVNEKCAPELLPRSPAADELAQAVAQQQAIVDDLGRDESSPAVALYQQDIERIRFLLASYARVRLRKIELQHFYIWHAEEAKANLSPAERALLERYVQARASHLMSNVVAHLPPRAGADTDATLAAMAESMRPALSTHVFARILESAEGLTRDDRGDAAGAGEEGVDIVVGRDALIQFAFIRRSLLEGKVQLH